jgi:hypothetical protein
MTTSSVDDCIDWLESWDASTDEMWRRMTVAHLRSIAALSDRVKVLETSLGALVGDVSADGHDGSHDICDCCTSVRVARRTLGDQTR